MNWETPKVVEIRMDAEIGSYQEDFGGDEESPIVSDRSAEPRPDSLTSS
jgi:hypothetical protein